MNSEHYANSDFKAFVKRERAAAAELDLVDWAREREDWLGHLKELYDQTESFLAEYIKSGETKFITAISS